MANYKRVYETMSALLKDNQHFPNRTVVFDFDDTIVDVQNFEAVNVKGFGPVEFYKIIPDMLNLVKNAKRLGYAVFIITARMPGTEWIVYNNLEHFCKGSSSLFDNIFASPISLDQDIGHFRNFKSVLRRNLELIDLKTACKINSKTLYEMELIKPFMNTLNIVLTVGDQPMDISYMSYYGLLLPRHERTPDMKAILYNKDRFIQKI